MVYQAAVPVGHMGEDGDILNRDDLDDMDAFMQTSGFLTSGQVGPRFKRLRPKPISRRLYGGYYYYRGKLPWKNLEVIWNFL
jgi:hypothetical protein